MNKGWYEAFFLQLNDRLTFSHRFSLFPSGKPCYTNILCPKRLLFQVYAKMGFKKPPRSVLSYRWSYVTYP
jgi:hypothetical protein